MKLPRFTLRELFLLVVIAALGCGWWVERQALIERAKAADQRVSEAELETFYYALSASRQGVKLPPMKRDDTVLGERNPFVRK